ncbi:MAG: vWA domain-containing protein [Bacteroidota bacterium]
MQRLLFESSPAFIIFCLATGLSYGYLLYKAKHTWSKQTNQLLFGLRVILVTFLTILLLGPILKFTSNIFERPSVVLLLDNSQSIRATVDSASRQILQQQLRSIKKELVDKGFEVAQKNLANEEVEDVAYTHKSSDLAGALREVTADYEGKNLAGLVLVSDGIYNSGSSPLYNLLRIPVYSIGVGDTTDRADLVLKNLAYNKIAYQGNKFPLRVEALVKGLHNQDVSVSVFQSGKLMSSQKRNTGNQQLLDFDFQLEAKETGIQRFDVVLELLSQEMNQRNNRASAYIEVIEGKKKILIIAPAPHPDIKVLRSVIEKNSNYDFILHMPGIKVASPEQLDQADLVIFHQVFDTDGKTNTLFSRFYKNNTALLVMIGPKTNLRQLPAAGIPLTFENSGQWDDATPIINSQFRDFAFSENMNGVFARYPPIATPFGKFTFPSNAQILLYQRIGSIVTERPLVLSLDENNRRIGVILGDGLWRWRLNEFSETESTDAFDEVFGKLIQYLSTKEDKRKFRSFPIQNEFTDAESVVFESQVYNDLYELVYGNKVDIELRDEAGKIRHHDYVTGSGNSRYRIGSLKEGVYRYRAATSVAGKPEEVRGEFLVTAQNIEAQNLTADFGLLRKMAAQTGGKFYQAKDLAKLGEELPQTKVKSLIHSDESFNSLINLKWVFFLLLALISIEWFVRKYSGGY